MKTVEVLKGGLSSLDLEALTDKREYVLELIHKVSSDINRLKEYEATLWKLEEYIFDLIDREEFRHEA